MSKLEIYTDGSCDNNSDTKNGAWAFVILDDGEVIVEKCGCATRTTNNKMELEAINAALSELPKNSVVTVHTDSQYCIGVLSKGWNATTNHDLIDVFCVIVGSNNIQVDFEWVKGHNGDTWNEYVNKLAYQELSILQAKTNKTQVDVDYKAVLTKLVESIEKIRVLKRMDAHHKSVEKAKRDYEKALKRAKEVINN